MISAYEMEKAANAAIDSFENTTYNPISNDAWLNSQRRRLEKQKRRTEAIQNAKQMVMEWFRRFQTKSIANA